jgi:hypothetical protein
MSTRSSCRSSTRISLTVRISAALSFIERCDFPPKCRAWKNADFLVLIVEVDRFLGVSTDALQAQTAGPALKNFYAEVDKLAAKTDQNPDAPPPKQAALDYYGTTLQATGDRQNRINRGRALRSVLASLAEESSPEAS